MAKFEGVVVTGEITEEQRIPFYLHVCEKMGLDPYARPLQYFEQVDRNGRRTLILYALRAASAQLARNYSLSSVVENQNPKFEGDLAVFLATVKDANGRAETAVGVVSLKGLAGKEYADGIMAAQTKAKRRAILDFCGFALLDESEIEGMRGGQIEVTEDALRSYVPAPPAPAPNDAPAAEIIPPEVPKTGSSVVEQPLDKRQVVGSSPTPSTTPAEVEQPKPVVLEAMPSKAEMEKLMFRLNVFKRDVLQRGGMRPSKGFGIAAKWDKFIRKHAPDRTMEQYQTLLTALDLMLQQTGDKGVVEKVEQEIA
jgi:hypothetical protein